MGLLSRMKDAGLGRALKESTNKTHQRCVDKHSKYLQSQGYNFCPICGIKLEIKHHCGKCGCNFLSEKAWEAHQNWHLGYPAVCKCRAHGAALERISEIRWRCKECGRIFDWLPKLTRNLNSPKVAKVIYEPRS